MDSMAAFAMGESARARNSPTKVFDWDKAAGILAERKPAEASAGLSGDLGWTAGVIWRGGNPVTDEYTFLSSIWATPVLIIDDDEIPCWVYQDGKPDWDAETKWPDSAIAVLHA